MLIVFGILHTNVSTSETFSKEEFLFHFLTLKEADTEKHPK